MLAEKELFMNEVKGKINPSSGFVITAYKNMNANSTAQFRDQLIKSGGDFFALKKRIFIKAAKDLGLTYELSELGGHIGIVIANNDFVATTKALFTFKEGNKEALDVLGGYFEGNKYSSNQVEKISALPSLDVMRAQFMGVLEAPMSQTLAVFDAILTSIIYCLDNKSKNES